MKNGFKKTISGLLIAVMLLCIAVTGFSSASAATEYTEGLYKYTVSDNEATITGRTNLIGDITIPSTLGGYTVTEIGDNALKTAGGISSVIIPASVKIIGSNAFYGCGNLKSVIIEDNSKLELLGDGAFTNCYVLENVDFGKNSSLKKIYNSVFVNCKALKSITIPETVGYIGESTFEGCSLLKEISIAKAGRYK